MSYPYRNDYADDSAPGHVVALAGELVPAGRTVVDLGAGAAAICRPLVERGFRYHGMDAHSEALRLMRAAGIDASACDLNDPEEVVARLAEVDGEVGAILLVDVVEHLSDPHALLARLSAWARANGQPHLLVSVPNVAHFDVAFRLLFGRWDPTATGILDATHLRFFYRDTLARLFARCGWSLVRTADFHLAESDQYAAELTELVPPSLYGALRVVAEQYNPFESVYQYVWALAPEALGSTPASFLEAVAPDGDAAAAALVPAPPEAVSAPGSEAIDAYLASIGILSVECGRRRDRREREREERARGLVELVGIRERELGEKNDYIRALVSQLQAAQSELGEKNGYVEALYGQLRAAGEEIDRKDARIAEVESYARSLAAELHGAQQPADEVGEVGAEHDTPG